jgi:hypothetical protein
MNAPDAITDYVRVINDVRLELESAGNPAYVVVIVEPNGAVNLSAMVYATVGHAADHATRLVHDLEPGEETLIVSRSEAAKRAMFTVVDPRTLKKLHQRLETIEETFADTNGPI